MKGLHEVGYKGLFNLEVGLAKVPLSVRDEALGYALKLAEEMIRGNI